MQLCPPEVDKYAAGDFMTYIQDLQRVHDKIDKIATDLRLSIVATSSKKSYSLYISLAALAVGVIGLPIMLASWIEPHLHADMKSDITIETQSQLRDPIKQLGSMSADIAEIKGELKALDPLIREMTTKRMREARNFSQADINSHLAELGGLVQVARTSKIPIEQQNLQEVGEKIVSASRNNPAAWNVALDFLNYKSFLDALSPKVPTGTTSTKFFITHYATVVPPPPGDRKPTFRILDNIAVPIEQAAKFNPIGEDENKGLSEGNPFLFVDGGGVVIDRLELKNVIFQGVHIVYHGGPLKMSNVYFVNCVFDVTKEQRGENFASTFLKSGPSTNFSAG